MALDKVGLSTQIWRWAGSPIDNLIHGLQCKQYPCLWFVILWLRGSAPCLPLLSMFLLDLFPTHESAEQFIAIHVCFQLLRVACKHCTSCVAPEKLQSSKALLDLRVLLSDPQGTSWRQWLSFEQCILFSF